MAEIDPEVIAEAAARRAKQAAVLAMLAVAVALAVLAIDNGIKRAILDEARKAREMLDQAHKLATVAAQGSVTVVKEAADAAEAAGPAGAPASPGDNGPDVLVDAPGAPAAASNHAGPRRRPASSRPAGKTARPRGDG